MKKIGLYICGFFIILNINGGMEMIEKNKRNNNILIIGVLIIFTICLIQLNMASVIPTAANVNDKTIGWGIKRANNNQQPDVGAANKKILEEEDGICIGKDNDKIIYLTFDEGYEAGYTDKILNTLKENDVKATFFVTCSGSLDKYAKKIIEKGHTIGLHTCTHRYNIIYSSEENYFNDLNSISAKVEELTGYKSKYIRFPGGSSNTISRFNKGIMTRLTQKVTEDGYKYYDWNIDSGDAAGADKEGVYNNVISALKNHNYSTNMVLMHDIKVSTKDALDSIIKDALDMGYTFSNINDYTNEVHHRINN